VTAAMDWDALAAGYEQAIPFSAFIGLKVKEISPGQGTVVLPAGENTMNHVRSQHAGALFTAGEAASGAAFISVFAERMADVTPLAQNAQISYTRIARGDITATGRFERDPGEIFAELDREGRVRFPIAVTLTDAEQNIVCEMSVEWYVRTKDA
jgi:acyl-coenzyme A thioesterase PaaI-like protein